MNNEALAHNVRGWVHYDNMSAALNKQIANARKQRDAYEEQIHVLLTQHQMGDSSIYLVQSIVLNYRRGCLRRKRHG